MNDLPSKEQILAAFDDFLAGMAEVREQIANDKRGEAHTSLNDARAAIDAFQGALGTTGSGT
jgi:hypothetical protein